MTLYDVDSVDAALEHVKADVEIAAVTCGPKGSLVVHDGEVIEIPAHPADRVVDTTGAGDLYAAGFLYGYTAGRPLEVCGRLGSMAATAVLGHTGPRPGLSLAQLAVVVGVVTDPDPWALVAAAALAIAERTEVERHDVLVVLGSGWTPAADRFGDDHRRGADRATSPGSPTSAWPATHAVLRSVEVDGGRRVLALLGRVHAYEGHDLAAVVHAVRSAVRAGCGTVVVTNAAGGLRPGMYVGQPVLISDHINLTGRSPLTGPEAPADLGLPRFVDLTEAYSRRLRDLAREIDPTLRKGCTQGCPGRSTRRPRRSGCCRSSVPISSG